MALIEKYHVVAAVYPVHAGEEIIEGMWVKLNSSGEVVLATGGASDEYALGVAGDTKTATTTVGIPTMNASHGFSADGVTGTTTSFVNRVSDQYDETKASGKITVYYAGGEFATNMYEPDVSTHVPGAPLYVSVNGKLTGTASTSAQVVAHLTKSVGAYESGVPGIDVRGSMTLGNYCEFKMVI